MATNWNSILSNTNSLTDVLAILKKVLASLEVKADVTTIDEALTHIEQLNIDVGSAVESVDTALEKLQLEADEVIAQGFYRGFATEALLLAAKPSVSDMRARADDTRKIWRWTRTSAEGVTPVTGDWTDTGLSELDQAKAATILTFGTFDALQAYVPKTSGQQALVRDTGLMYTFESNVATQQSETIDFTSRMSVQPNSRQLNAINKLYYDLKSKNLLSKIKGLWSFCSTNYTDAKLNFIANVNNLELVSGTLPIVGANPSFIGISNTVFDTKIQNTQNGVIGLLFQTGSLPPDGSVRNLIGCFDGTKGVAISPYESGKISTRFNTKSRINIDQNFKKNTTNSLTHRLKSTTMSTFVNENFINEKTVETEDFLQDNILIGGLSKNGTLNGSGNLEVAYIASEDLSNFEIIELHSTLLSYIRNFKLAITGNWVVQKNGQFDLSTLTSPDQIQKLAKNAQEVEKTLYSGEESLSITNNISFTLDESVVNQTYLGEYIEIQPDSFNGSGFIPATDGITDTWGFPQSLLPTEQSRLRSLCFSGNGKGIMYVRFPLGFAYRGFRNIDSATGLAKNIGERYSGQNIALKKLFEKISEAGGGLAPEYWCPPVYWTTNSAYAGSGSNINKIWAGGTYSRSTELVSIRDSDPIQYAKQINDFTNAVVNDYEYLHQNIAPVRMYSLQNEPMYGNAIYGSMLWSDVVYSDVMSILAQKVEDSEILATWGGLPNKPKLHISSADSPLQFGKDFNNLHKDKIWGYSYHRISEIGSSADYIKNTVPLWRSTDNLDNVFCNETEYFTPPVTKFDKQFCCSNNMLRDVHNFVYGNAQVNMPIIHICKQIGQASRDSNTDGYALFKCNLQEGYGLSPSDVNNTDAMAYGTFMPVLHNYIAYKFIADNLPVGAVRIGGITGSSVTSFGFAVFKFQGKLIIFIANSKSTSTRLNLSFATHKKFSGKRYDLDNDGTILKSKEGLNIAFDLRNASGQVWTEI